MQNKTISIIGGTGKMGSAFAKAFKEKGFNVIVSGRNTKITNEEAASKGDIVIISVPIKITEKVIRQVSPFLKGDSILTDLTSIKSSPCKAMKKYSQFAAIGGHPLFGPGVKFQGRTIVLCPVRGNKISELKEIYRKVGLKIIVMSAEDHDKEMGIIQCMNHFSNISFANALYREGFKIHKETLFTPAFKLKLAVTGRMLSQHPELYPEMLIRNPYSKKIIKSYIKSVKEVRRIIKKKDESSLQSMIVKLKKYFGNISEESRDITNKTLEYMKNKRK